MQGLKYDRPDPVHSRAGFFCVQTLGREGTGRRPEGTAKPVGSITGEAIICSLGSLRTMPYD
jgi:hypothetical protein